MPKANGQRLNERREAVTNPPSSSAAIVARILEGYCLPVRGMHGILHWGRVHENGRILAERLGADAEIVALFALFHDARRANENRDPGHGLRGAELARSLRGTLVHVDDRRFGLFYEACRLHTDGLTTGEVSLQVCWDADRLDLGRVGIRPDPRRLCTDAAREMLPAAHRRALEDWEPAIVTGEWGVGRQSQQ